MKLLKRGIFCSLPLCNFRIHNIDILAGSYTIRQSYEILVCAQSFILQPGLQGIVSSYGSRRSYEMLVAARRAEERPGWSSACAAAASLANTSLAITGPTQVVNNSFLFFHTNIIIALIVIRRL